MQVLFNSLCRFRKSLAPSSPNKNTKDRLLENNHQGLSSDFFFFLKQCAPSLSW